jgi:glycosyltransferase involved in cell wall biosynthesis
LTESLYIVRPTLGAGGADRVTLTLLEHLPRDLFRPTLVLMRGEGELLADLPSNLPLLTLEARSLWTAWLPLMGIVRRDRPDILFSTSSGANIIATIAHLLTGSSRRLVLSERNVLRTELTWRKRIQSWLKGVLYPQADRITAVSKGVKQELVNRLRLEPNSVSVVYNPIVDDSLATMTTEVVDHPWFLGGPEDNPPIVLTAGRLVVEKDHAHLIRSFAILRRSRRARLIILGEGPLRPDLESLARELDVDEYVSMPGFDPNPLKYMARCQLFVLSSRFEGLPGALIQAMSCGAPVISTDCPCGPSEILEGADSGILVPVGDSAGLAAEMKRVLDDPDLSCRLKEGARKAAMRFSVDAVIGNYTRALR